MVDRCSHLEYPLKTVAARASIVWFLALDAILDLADFLFSTFAFYLFLAGGEFLVSDCCDCCLVVAVLVALFIVVAVVVIVEILVAALACLLYICIYLWSSLVAVGNFHTAAHSTVSHD